MIEDNQYQVIYECSECGETKALDDESLYRISEEFERLGWLNIPAPGIGEKIEYTVFCPSCAHELELDDALEMEREQQADNDFFLADTGR